jgi:hypothetical protein
MGHRATGRSIDQTFIAQQLKVVSQAELDTQKEGDQAVEVTRAQEKTALGTDSLPRLLFKFTQEPQQSIKNSQRMRWPAGDEQINRNNRSCAVIDL